VNAFETRRRADSPADVDRQFDELWRAAATDDQPVVRACSTNLIVVTEEDDSDMQRAIGQVRRITEAVPGRVFVVGPAREAEEFEVYVTAHCHVGHGGAQVCSEQIAIQPTTATLDRVGPSVLQLLVEEMPVSTWWRRPGLDLPELFDPLMALSDCLVVDSTLGERPDENLARLAALGDDTNWQGRLADLAWVRLEPWREAVASFFDRPARHGATEGIVRARIAAGEVAGAYLAGWLVSRLGLVRAGEAWAHPSGKPVEIVVAGGPDAAADEVRAVTIQAQHGGESLVLDATRERLRLPETDEAGLVCAILQRSGSETVYRQALREISRRARA
jgi:glucose-6-phosphate dehydrogenase assembly protein OpcA